MPSIPANFRSEIVALAVLFFLGFISSQRFFIPDVSALICIVVLIIPVVFGKRDFATFSFIALLSIVDLGGRVYAETPSVIKYLIYLSAFIGSFYVCKYQFSKRFVGLYIFILIVLLNTLTHPHRIDIYTFARDLITLLIVILVYLSRFSPLVDNLKISYLMFFSVGIVLSELVNIAFFYDVTSGSYLNYSSLKFVVLLPLVYFLCFKKYLYALVVAPFIYAIIVAFGARMLLITSLIILSLLLIRGASLHFFRTISLIIALASFFGFALMNLSVDLSAFRVVSMFDVLVNFESISSIALLLDPVRFTENNYFFSQDLYFLFLGNGLGTGILDTTGQFTFINDDGGAFSTREVNEGHFFRLHDSWTWFGFRFGLLAYLAVILWGAMGCFHRDPMTAFLATLMLLALFNSTFSIGGLIACAVLALHYKMRSQGSNIGLPIT